MDLSANPPDARGVSEAATAGTRSLVTQPPAAPPAQPNHRDTLPSWTVLLLGVALALAAADPPQRATGGPLGWLLMAAMATAAVWAAPVVAQRPTAASVKWTGLLVRHRNTAFAVACTVLAAFGDPPVWLMVVDAALLLAYLLAVDALAAGPIGIRQLRHSVAPMAAAAASALALLGARAPVDSGAVWGRIVAALAVAAAALAVGAALWVRQADPRAARDRIVSLRQRRDKPRHL